MSEVCSNLDGQQADLLHDPQPQDDVVQHKSARASDKPKLSESEIPPKKRKTRRGKSKRKYPYIKGARKSNKMIKPEAPHNSNQFLLEDHGVIEDLDENLKCADQVSTSTVVTRTRDSSFSVDSEGEFYSSPDDEEQFLIKDFVDQYESVQAERLHSLSKAQLIEEYHQLENKVELLSKRLQKQEDKEQECDDELVINKPELQREIERLKIENERLKRENELLRSKMVSCSDSEDSETDSSDSCSSSTSNSSITSCNSSRQTSPAPEIDYSHTNGHTSPPASVEPV